MATIKSYTDLDQSMVLADILPLESVDTRYHIASHLHYTVEFGKASDKDIPCWSLAALLDVMPKGTDIIKEEADTENEKYMCTVGGIKDDIMSTFARTPVDACVEMIVKLHKLKML